MGRVRRERLKANITSRHSYLRKLARLQANRIDRKKKTPSNN
ncbi:hypothetical protein VPHK391_0106 [Vibrio phage K391]